MAISDLVFEDNSGAWWPPRDSVRFTGTSGGIRFDFFASAEAIQAAAHLASPPSGHAAVGAFNEHFGKFVALATRMWLENSRAQPDGDSIYLITDAMITAQRW